MVSGRHKAYEKAKPTGDSLANDTSASSFSLDLTAISDAKINKRHVTVSGRSFSRKVIDNLVEDAKDPRRHVQSIRGYAGQEPQLVEACGKNYVGLMKLKSSGGHMRFIVYDFSDGQVKQARTKFERRPVEPDPEDSPEHEYDDFVDKLLDEYENRG